jgi:DNA primase
MDDCEHGVFAPTAPCRPARTRPSTVAIHSPRAAAGRIVSTGAEGGTVPQAQRPNNWVGSEAPNRLAK